MTTLNRGNGSDGNVTISSNKNLNTDIVASGRSYADMICYSVTAVGSQSVTVSSGTINGIVASDEVLLMNVQGISSGYANTGNYETFIVDSINGLVITFQTQKAKYYGEGATNDTNIGISSTDQKVIIQRVPQYDNMTINNTYTLTANAFDGLQGGVLFFRVKNTLTINGIVDLSELGYRGGDATAPPGGGGGPPGESISGQINASCSSNNVGGGGGGPNDGWGASGGGYGVAGVSNSHSTGGVVYGEQTLCSGIYFGSGGGCGDIPSTGGAKMSGGNGGGLIAIFGNTVDVYGSIVSNGGTPGYQDDGGSAGGTGGTVLIQAGMLSLHSSTIQCVKGSGGPAKYEDGKDGGDGRIAVYYNTLTDSISTSPTAYTSSGVQLPYKFSGTLNEAAEIRIYNIGTGVLIRKVNHPAGAYEIDNVPEVTVDVVAKATDGEIKGYGDVVPVSS